MREKPEISIHSHSFTVQRHAKKEGTVIEMSGISLLPIVQIKIMLNHDGKRRRQTRSLLAALTLGKEIPSKKRNGILWPPFNILFCSHMLAAPFLAFTHLTAATLPGGSFSSFTIKRKRK